MFEGIDIFPEMRKTFNVSVKLRDLTDEMMKRIPDALVEIAEQIHYDVDNVEPVIPVLTGALRKSKEITKINKTKVELSYGGKFVGDDSGTDVDYALKVHEGLKDLPQPINWTRPGSGPYFLESKISNKELVDKWVEVGTRELRDALKDIPND
mgnify:CR=1 FL=1|jgi:hypothetical protein